jgi:hypothetical protein
MARRTPFKKALDAALRQGPADAVTLLGRLYEAGWKPKRRPEDSVHGLHNSMQHRLGWRCQRGGMAAKMLVGQVNVYVAAGAVREVAARFDLNDPQARLVAADFLEDRGQTEVAGLLRRCRKWTFGPEGRG